MLRQRRASRNNRKQKFEQLNEAEKFKILQSINPEIKEENDLKEVILEDPSNTKLLLALRRAKKMLHRPKANDDGQLREKA